MAACTAVQADRGRQASHPHWAVLVLCLALVAGTLAAAAVLRVDDVMYVGARRLPSVCTLKNATGIPCPGCGLTRSWVALAQGRPLASLGHHRLGWLVALYVVLQTARHGAWLAIRGFRPWLDRAGRWLDRGILVLAAGLLVNWVVTLTG